MCQNGVKMAAETSRKAPKDATRSNNDRFSSIFELQFGGHGAEKGEMNEQQSERAENHLLKQALSWPFRCGDGSVGGVWNRICAYIPVIANIPCV